MSLEGSSASGQTPWQRTKENAFAPGAHQESFNKKFEQELEQSHDRAGLEALRQKLDKDIESAKARIADIETRDPDLMYSDSRTEHDYAHKKLERFGERAALLDAKISEIKELENKNEQERKAYLAEVEESILSRDARTDEEREATQVVRKRREQEQQKSQEEQKPRSEAKAGASDIWGTDTQNKIAEKIAAAEKGATTHEVKYGETLIPILRGMKLGGAPELVDKNVFNLKVIYRYENQVSGEIPLLSAGKVWEGNTVSLIEGSHVVVNLNSQKQKDLVAEFTTWRQTASDQEHAVKDLEFTKMDDAETALVEEAIREEIKESKETDKEAAMDGAELSPAEAKQQVENILKEYGGSGLDGDLPAGGIILVDYPAPPSSRGDEFWGDKTQSVLKLNPLHRVGFALPVGMPQDAYVFTFELDEDTGQLKSTQSEFLEKKNKEGLDDWVRKQIEGQQESDEEAHSDDGTEEREVLSQREAQEIAKRKQGVEDKLVDIFAATGLDDAISIAGETFNNPDGEVYASRGKDFWLGENRLVQKSLWIGDGRIDISTSVSYPHELYGSIWNAESDAAAVTLYEFFAAGNLQPEPWVQNAINELTGVDDHEEVYESGGEGDSIPADTEERVQSGPARPEGTTNNYVIVVGNFKTLKDAGKFIDKLTRNGHKHASARTDKEGNFLVELTNFPDQQKALDYMRDNNLAKVAQFTVPDPDGRSSPYLRAINKMAQPTGLRDDLIYEIKLNFKNAILSDILEATLKHHFNLDYEIDDGIDSSIQLTFDLDGDFTSADLIQEINTQLAGTDIRVWKNNANVIRVTEAAAAPESATTTVDDAPESDTKRIDKTFTDFGLDGVLNYILFRNFGIRHKLAPGVDITGTTVSLTLAGDFTKDTIIRTLNEKLRANNASVRIRKEGIDSQVMIVKDDTVAHQEPNENQRQATEKSKETLRRIIESVVAVNINLELPEKDNRYPHYYLDEPVKIKINYTPKDGEEILNQKQIDEDSKLSLVQLMLADKLDLQKGVYRIKVGVKKTRDEITAQGTAEKEVPLPRECIIALKKWKRFKFANVRDNVTGNLAGDFFKNPEWQGKAKKAIGGKVLDLENLHIDESDGKVTVSVRTTDSYVKGRSTVKSANGETLDTSQLFAVALQQAAKKAYLGVGKRGQNRIRQEAGKLKKALDE